MQAIFDNTSSQGLCLSHTGTPCYSPSGPPPTYCLRASRGEEVLAQTLSSNSYRIPSGSYTKDLGRIKVCLIEQEDGAEAPSYDRGGVICGTVDVDNPEDILRVDLQIEGKLKINIFGTNAVSKTINLVDQNYQLWSRRQSPGANAASSDTTSLCPSVLSFSSTLPLRYHEEEPNPHNSPLPPSFEIDIPGVPGLSVKSVYAIRFTLVTRRALWDKRKTFCIPFKYRPRRRSPQPVLLNDISDGGLIDTVKLHPEDWFQTDSVLQARPSTKLPPIDVQIFIPSTKIFAVSDTIPFHIQLYGPKASLKELYDHLELELVEETDPTPGLTSFSSSASLLSSTSGGRSPSLKSPTGSLKAQRKRKDDHLVLTMSVSIHRQISARGKGQQVWKTLVIGAGKIKALPPFFECAPPGYRRGGCSSAGLDENSSRSAAGGGSCPYAPEEQEFLRCLDWEGKVRCRDDIDLGSFDSGRVTVTDFLVLKIGPRPHQNQPAFLPLRTAVPITLVTDSWNDGVY